jgi:hypothetical protein
MIGKNRTGATSNGLIHHIVAYQADAGCRALNASNYKRALRLFTENIDKRKYYDPHKWNSSLAHGRAWAYLGLKDSESALKEIDTAIAIHVERSGGKYGQSWQFKHDPNRSCLSMIHLLTTKALILDHLDRESEEKVCRNEVTKGATDYPSHYSHPMGFTRPYEVFEDKMSLITKDILTLLKGSIP